MNYRHKISVLVVFQALSFGAPHEARQQEELLDKGIKLTAEGRFIDAVTAFSHCKQAAPEDSRPYFYSGVALTEAGRLSAAALELNEAVRLDPNRPEYRIFQANVFTRLKQQDHATSTLAVLEEKGKVSQLPTAWLWLLSDVYYRLQKTPDALRILDLLGERHPEDSQIDLNRGQTYLIRNEFELALQAFKRSIEKSGQNALAYFELGKIFHQRNELAEAKKVLLEAVRQNGANPEYLHRLGLVCLGRGELGEAIEYLKRAEPSGSAFPQIYYALSLAYRRSGEQAMAGEYREKFQEANLALQKKERRARDAAILLAEGEKLFDQGRMAEARAKFEQVLEIDSDNWDARGYLAEIFVSSGNWQLAHQHLVKMEKLDPDSVVGNYLAARYWYQRKEFERARLYGEKVKFARPGHAELRNLLGNIYLELGQEERARDEYEAAVRLAPDRADLRENLNRIEKRRGQTGQKSVPPPR
ncbi:MAG TPA: tetratricopeptide repeat protein [Acidobacteriota bacterium]